MAGSASINILKKKIEKKYWKKKKKNWKTIIFFNTKKISILKNWKIFLRRMIFISVLLLKLQKNRKLLTKLTISIKSNQINGVSTFDCGIVFQNIRLWLERFEWIQSATQVRFHQHIPECIVGIGAFYSRWNLQMFYWPWTKFQLSFFQFEFPLIQYFVLSKRWTFWNRHFLLEQQRVGKRMNETNEFDELKNVKMCSLWTKSETKIAEFHKNLKKLG